MEQELSARLLKHLNHIRDMVDYQEVSGHLLTSGIISQADHQIFLGKVYNSGNSKGMEELVNVLNLRRGGFSAFVDALRVNDYNWLAEQMDPEPIQKPENSKKRFQGLLRRKSSRSSEARMSAETVFTSYRQTFPMELASSCRTLNHCMSPTLTKSFDSLSLSTGKPTSASALLLNIKIPDNQKPPPKDSELVSTIAQQLDFPLTEYLTSLKRISVQSKKSLVKTKSASRVNLKIKFKCKDARDRFVEEINSSSQLFGVRGVPLDDKSGSDSATDVGSGTWLRKLLKKR